MDSVSTAVSTHCPYCALQCGMDLTCDGDRIDVAGNRRFPVNEGGLCLKGWSAAATLRHPDRLLSPLARNADGMLVPVSWEIAIDSIASAIRATQASYGRDAVGVFGGGSLTNEKAYLLGKFARVALGTSNVDYNGRFCMSSAAAGASKAFGIDRGLPFPLEDIPACRSDPARRRQHGRDDAADHAVLRSPAAQWRSADRRRPTSLADRAVGASCIWRCVRDLMRRWRTGWFTC